MKKIVLVLIALASFSFASEKKEDCMSYVKEGDSYVERAEKDRDDQRKAVYASLATANYLKYQICKDLQKRKINFTQRVK